MIRFMKYLLTILIVLSLSVFIVSCNTPASDQIIGKWSGATEKNMSIAKEAAEKAKGMSEKDKENPFFDEEIFYLMYSTIQIEITTDKFKMVMGELGDIQNYKIISESKDTIILQTEDGEQFKFTINNNDEIVFEDDNLKMYLAKI